MTLKQAGSEGEGEKLNKCYKMKDLNKIPQSRCKTLKLKPGQNEYIVMKLRY